MRVVIAGGGNVGTFIAEDLAKAGHDVTLVEVDADLVAAYRKAVSPGRHLGGGRRVQLTELARICPTPTWWLRSPATTRTTW